MKNIVKIRAVLSSMLIVLFFLVLFTGIGLFFLTSEKFSQIAGLTFLGFKEAQLKKVHVISGFLMSALILIHLSLNYRMFLGEIKLLFKK